jgi:hypothetical protein
MGQVVLTEQETATGENQLSQVDIDQLESGIYILKIKNESSMFGSEMILIND